MVANKKKKVKKKSVYIVFPYNPCEDGWKIMAIANFNKIENDSLNKENK